MADALPRKRRVCRVYLESLQAGRSKDGSDAEVGDRFGLGTEGKKRFVDIRVQVELALLDR